MEYVLREAGSVAAPALSEALEALANLGKASMSPLLTAREERIMKVFREGGHACPARKPGLLAQLYTGKPITLEGHVRLSTLWKLTEHGLLRETGDGADKVWVLR